MNKLKFRSIVLDDIAKIMEIEPSIYSYPWTEGIFKDCIKAGYLGFIAEQKNKIVAYGVISVGAGESHILNISVPKEQQKKGYGKQLLHHMICQAKINKADMALLEVRESNRNAIALYESQGFNEIGVRKAYYPAPNGKEDAIMFAKHL
ncbi:MAG: ribosomal protein S18-alanine N-acetyltransferase [Gammaproteobacteria bacterium]|nr:ribosomal protein S18-alanine N-acetyltransferase [Gammaproteobacteria bacterium]